MCSSRTKMSARLRLGADDSKRISYGRTTGPRKAQSRFSECKVLHGIGEAVFHPTRPRRNSSPQPQFVHGHSLARLKSR